VNLVLIGPRGSGKTSVGRLVALRLQRPFLDTDEMVATEAGKTIAAIFDEGGEALFRRLEARAAAKASRGGPSVISAGGGAVEKPENVNSFRDGGTVFWLSADPRILARRISNDKASQTSRPSLTGLGRDEEVSALYRRREPLYRGASHHRVDTGSLTPEEVATEVVKIFLNG
jgi:shikimate kinase